MRTTDNPTRDISKMAALATATLLVSLAGCGSAASLAADTPTSSPPSPSSTTSTTSTTSTAPSPTSPSSSPTASPTASAPTTSASPTVARPKTGECRVVNRFDATLRVVDTAGDPIGCSNKHTAQTYKVLKMTPKISRAIKNGTEKQTYLAARGACASALPKWLGVGTETLQMSQFEFVVGIPDSTELAAGADLVRCDAVLFNGRTHLLSLPKTTRGALSGSKWRKYQSCIRTVNIASAFNGSFTCQGRHHWRAVSAFKLGRSTSKYPGTSRLQARARARCTTDVRGYLNTTGAFQYGYVVPTRSLWGYGDRYGKCYAQTTS